MLSIILTVVMLVGLSSCNKEYKKSDNSNVAIVDELNQGHFEEVIQKLEGREDLSDSEKFYLGSAYSQKGGVDVFSLYSVLEIQLFHKKALDWSDLSKEKNPYLKFMKSQDGVDYEKRKKKRLKRWEHYLPQIKAKHNLREIPVYEHYQFTKDNKTISKEQFDSVNQTIHTKWEEVNKSDLTYDGKLEVLRNMNFDFNQWTDEGANLGALSYEIANDYADQIRLEQIKYEYLNPENGSVFSDVQWEMVYMNILWNTYEAIPLMKKLPSLSVDQQDNVSLSLEKYAELIDSKEYKDVIFKNMAILTGVSLLSIYKSSFDMDDVDGIQDLYCTFDPEVLISNYSLIRKRLIFIQEFIEKVAPDNEKYKTYKSKIEEMKKVLPEEMTPEKQDSFRDSVDKFKLERCFNS